MKLPAWTLPLLLRIHDWGMARPYFDLTGYMLRGWVLGFHSALRNHGNRAWHGRTRGRLHAWLTSKVAIRAHTVLRSDNERHLHDHPAASLSIVLAGGYWEVMPPNAMAVARPLHYHALLEVLPYGMVADAIKAAAAFNIHWRGPGAIVLRKATDRHRLILPNGATSKSLFVLGPKVPGHRWGFDTPHGKIPHEEYRAYRARVELDELQGERRAA